MQNLFVNVPHHMFSGNKMTRRVIICIQPIMLTVLRLPIMLKTLPAFCRKAYLIAKQAVCDLNDDTLYYNAGQKECLLYIPYIYIQYSGASDKGPSEKGTASQQ